MSISLPAISWASPVKSTTLRSRKRACFSALLRAMPGYMTGPLGQINGPRAERVENERLGGALPGSQCLFGEPRMIDYAAFPCDSVATPCTRQRMSWPDFAAASARPSGATLQPCHEGRGIAARLQPARTVYQIG